MTTEDAERSWKNEFISHANIFPSAVNDVVSQISFRRVAEALLNNLRDCTKQQQLSFQTEGKNAVEMEFIFHYDSHSLLL